MVPQVPLVTALLALHKGFNEVRSFLKTTRNMYKEYSGAVKVNTSVLHRFSSALEKASVKCLLVVSSLMSWFWNHKHCKPLKGYSIWSINLLSMYTHCIKILQQFPWVRDTYLSSLSHCMKYILGWIDKFNSVLLTIVLDALQISFHMYSFNGSPLHGVLSDGRKISFFKRPVWLLYQLFSLLASNI